MSPKQLCDNEATLPSASSRYKKIPMSKKEQRPHSQVFEKFDLARLQPDSDAQYSAEDIPKIIQSKTADDFTRLFEQARCAWMQAIADSEKIEFHIQDFRFSHRIQG